MKAVIIAGGKGERLRPLTNTIPKPMIDVNGKPVLEHIVDLFKKNGIRDFIFTLCYLPDKITTYFGDGSKFGVNIKYVYENSDRPLGTAGGIALAKQYIDGTFIVTSGDILRKLDIKRMIKYHQEKKAFATLNAYKRFGPDPKSVIVFGKENRITDFIERPSLTTSYVWSNGSFYIFEPQILNYISQNKQVDFGKDIFPELLKNNKRMYVYQSSDYFIDVGNMEKLEKARKTYKSEKLEC